MAEYVKVLEERKRMCKNLIGCKKCALSCENNSLGELCTKFCVECPEEAEKIIMQWAKEHPIKTNADKFKEVFGVETGFDDTCSGVKCPSSTQSCSECEYREFWLKEYVEPKE